MRFISAVLYFTSIWMLVTAASTSSNKCKEIKSCRSMDWLMRNREKVPFSKSQIFEVLGNIACGFDQQNPKVLCTEDVVIADDEDNDEEDENASLRTGVISGFSAYGSGCLGSVVYRELKEKSFGVSKIHRRKRSIDGSVFHVEVIGNCCWRGYERKRFRGSSELYRPGSDTCPGIVLKSIHKVECPNGY